MKSRNLINLSHIRDLTIDYGEGWGYAHVCRVLHLVKAIGAELTFNENMLIYAVYLHDWGAFPRFCEPGVEHALRSVQVAEREILPHTNLAVPDRERILDAIGLHDYRDLRPATTIEALLLREADMLDMLGAIGAAREFAWGPNDLKVCYSRILAHREAIAGRFTLPRAQSLAVERLRHMDTLLANLQEESFDLL